MDGRWAGVVIPESVGRSVEACRVFEEVVRQAREGYERLLELGIPKEDARYVLPQGVTSTIMVTMNARELLHFFRVRLCKRAHWEIRELASKMLEKVREVAPILFEDAGPSCKVLGFCPEEKPCKERRMVVDAEGDS